MKNIEKSSKPHFFNFKQTTPSDEEELRTKSNNESDISKLENLSSKISRFLPRKTNKK